MLAIAETGDGQTRAAGVALRRALPWALAAALVALTLYILTASPTITWRNSGWLESKLHGNPQLRLT